MAKREHELLRETETHTCPYCGKEIKVAVGPYGLTYGVFRGDQSIESQLAEKRLRTEEFDKAVKKAEEKKKFSY